MRKAIGCCLFLLGCTLLHGQTPKTPPNKGTAPKVEPAPVKTPDEAIVKQIVEKTAELAKVIAALPASVTDEVKADIEIHHKAAVWIVRHHDYFHNDSAKWTLRVLDLGMTRAKLAAEGKTPWLAGKGKVVRGYRSKVDGSVQPYAVSYPAGYATKKISRVDLVLHGRDGTICEVKFINSNTPAKEAASDLPFVQIDLYGRGNNAYRWAGESDVYEAYEHFLASEKAHGRDWIDRSKTVLRGFSMGGAGSWQLGLHRPDRFSVVGPGAGFTVTHGYAKLPDMLPDYIEKCLHIYDAADYSENAFNVPIVAYSGDKDPQMAAAVNIEKRLKEAGLSKHMTHLVAPGLAHMMPAEWQKKAEAEYAKYAGPGRPKYPSHVRFVTYSLLFSQCEWVRIEALGHHYEKAIVDAVVEPEGSTLTVKTTNVARLTLSPPGKTTSWKIDGQEMQAHPGTTLFKSEGKWIVPRAEGGLTKKPGLHGPIDHAFMDRFEVVLPTASGWTPTMDSFAKAQADRFSSEWNQWMRGDLPVVKKPSKEAHWVLFGDPQSNPLLAEVIAKIPELTWTKETITIGGKAFDAKGHLPVMIYPNPLNPGKYVVINSGHTIHEADFRGTNALLFPKLGDYAVLTAKPTAKEPWAFDVAIAGIFDEAWKVVK